MQLKFCTSLWKFTSYMWHHWNTIKKLHSHPLLYLWLLGATSSNHWSLLVSHYETRQLCSLLHFIGVHTAFTQCPKSPVPACTGLSVDSGRDSPGTVSSLVFPESWSGIWKEWTSGSNAHWLSPLSCGWENPRVNRLYMNKLWTWKIMRRFGLSLNFEERFGSCLIVPKPFAHL